MPTSSLYPTITSRTTATPPGSPSNTAHYIIPSSPTGAWVGYTNYITWYENSAWTFTLPPTGMQTYVLDEGNTVEFNGTAWVIAVAPSGFTRDAVADVNYTVTGTTNQIVAYTSITAARTITLPAATTAVICVSLFTV